MDEKRLQEIEENYKICDWLDIPDDVTELLKEIHRLREALAFYGDASNYKDFIPGHESLNGVWNIDNRYRARVALGLEPAPETPQD